MEIIKRALKYIFSGIPVVEERHVDAIISVMSPNVFLSKRCALITGGTSGIGIAIAKAFVNADAFVIITGRNEERLNAAVSTINQNYEEERCVGFVLDNRDVTKFETKLREILTITGKKIDILVNNAGINGGHISNVEVEEYDQILQTNLRSVFFLSKLMGKFMRDNKIEGNILNISSASSIRPALSAYHISKWGIRGLTMGLARALAPYGIVVNSIAPGPTSTPMLLKDCSNINHPRNLLHRYATPEEIANMAVFLTSNMGRTIIGDTIFMSGGGGIVTNEDVDFNI